MRSASSTAPTSPSQFSDIRRESLRPSRFPVRGPNATLVATLRCGKSSGSCMSNPTRRSWVATWMPADVSVSTRSPATTVPESGRTRPEITCNTVDLPAPFAPSRASTSPGATLNSTSSRRLSTTARTSSPLTGHQPLTPPALSLRLPSPSTTTAATATNSTDNATAASASVSRCR
jgi:hypothetical protein